MDKNILEKILEGSMEPTDLPLELLRQITDGFSTHRIVGEGGFATVYEGIIGNRNVAVKRIKSSMTIDDKLFRREVDSLMKVKHQNVIRFLGYCSHTVETRMENAEYGGYIYVERRERLLCLEYISNGSLDQIISDELRGLEWEKRYEIIKGICTGLSYLHMEKSILHMDLKPANILLDNDMTPKITDFGLSRPTENSKTMSTTHFVSPGYCAPENIVGCGRMSVQSDMYSLGVIIMEIVTGHKGIPEINDNILRRWRHRWNKSGQEPSLKYHDQVTKCIEIGSLCQKDDPFARPSISAIMSEFVELETMDYWKTITHESTVCQTKPPYWEDDMLGVEPLELQFANSGNDKQLLLPCSVELSNNTDSFTAFEVQTTSPLPYSIEPKKGIVKPRSKCIVDITLTAANTRHHDSKRYTKEFIVRSIKVEEGHTTNDMNEDVFDKCISGHHVDEIYLSVIFEDTSNKEVTDSPSKQAKQYTSSGDKCIFGLPSCSMPLHLKQLDGGSSLYPSTNISTLHSTLITGLPRQLVLNVGILIVKIKQAAYTAKQHKGDCDHLVLNLSMLENGLGTLQDDPELEQPLDMLYKTLQEAHNLVVACQKRGSFFKKPGLDDKFREVNARIISDLSIFPLFVQNAIARRLCELRATNHTEQQST